MPQPPRNPVFDAALGGDLLSRRTIARKNEESRIATLQAALRPMLERAKARPRVEQFLPYLLIRSFLGDQGARPYSPSNTRPPYTSPDIWILRGDPTQTPNVPSNHGDSVLRVGPTTAYAHVWNLGRAPVIGATVEFLELTGYNIVPPNFVPTIVNLQMIGTATVDLAPRSSPECHKLVKCSTAWSVPARGSVGRRMATLVVRVSGIGDPIGADPYWAIANRHVAMQSFRVNG